MNSPNPRRWVEKVKYVIVERDGVDRDAQLEDIYAAPTPIIDQILSQSYTKRQELSATDDGNDSDDEDDLPTTSTAATPSSGGPPPVRTY